MRQAVADARASVPTMLLKVAVALAIIVGVVILLGGAGLSGFHAGKHR